MKNSIAKNVTRKVSLLLVIAFVILFVASFLGVSYFVFSRTEKYARAIVSIYSDLAVYKSEIENKPIDFENADLYDKFGSYMCAWYSIDYAFLCVPDTESGELKLLSISEKDENETEELRDKYAGKAQSYEMTEEERSVWEGKQIFATTGTNIDNNRGICTLIRVSDVYDNKVLAGVIVSYTDMISQILAIFSAVAFIILAVIIGIYIAVYYIIRKKVSEPAKVLSENMQAFIKDGKRSETRLKESGSDEYIMIASAFNSMTENIDNYVDNINRLTREQERHQTELDIASRIQKGFLPKEYFETDDCVIRSVMIPAKNVGGDLYDYLPLDGERLLTVIADVSGKGTYAAMFMSVTLMLIRMYAKMNFSPAEILEKVNESLSDNNSELLFITAFIGIYDKKDKTYTYSNAGHNLPYVISKEIDVLPCDSGMLLGIFKGEKYKNQTVKLNAGDTVFLYTDGVNESVNTEAEFYGMQRLESELQKLRNLHTENYISFINKSLEDFSNGADRHDDITMLTLTVKDTKTLLLDAEIPEFEKIKSEILALPLEREQKLNLCLAAEECFVNICSYAFEEDKKKDEKIEVTVSVSDRVELIFKDGGIEFNPLEHVSDPETYDIDVQIGGLGTFIALANVDDMRYEYKNDKNILTFIKYFEEEKK